MLEKQIIIDKIEILENGIIQVREATIILEDGVVISRKTTNRRVIEPDQPVDTDSADIQAIAGIVRTKERVDAYIAKKEKKNV